MDIRIVEIRYAEIWSPSKQEYICRLEGEKRWRKVNGTGPASYPWITYKGKHVDFREIEPWVGGSYESWRKAKVFKEPVVWEYGRPLYPEDLVGRTFIRLYPDGVQSMERAGYRVLPEDQEGLYSIIQRP